MQTTSGELKDPYMIVLVCHQIWHLEELKVPMICPVDDEVDLGDAYVCCLSHHTVSGCPVSSTCCSACRQGES